ncbi:phosphate ABC transporter substrate-binding protein PstS [Microbacter margulisiae]|uniref:Phosphate-binding protein n=1 Tax=Microbacter margulisiae TaxID=1350067 RepID=A0A7W5DSR9_9PORP|nr:phosphate ABC transporter substrate-binding protein PstS [Microbacter margulisiae]MBB3188236.1 phosphate transport system substrate-binding protein [Microbacter margulisiae]
MKKIGLFLALALVIASCHSGKKNSVALSGAGSTFVMPFYTTAFQKYTPLTGVKISYGGVGSGAGIKSLKDRVVDFGASDAFMTDAQMAAMPAPVVEFPTCSGAVVMAFNLPGITTMKLTPEVLADIYLGKITNWNDPALAKINPGVKFPNLPITVVHRSDGSGTTNIFTNYLTKVSPEWKSKYGFGTTVNWPVGVGGKGNPGVAGTISQTTGAFGYVESTYAFAEKIPFASIKNQAGIFITPSFASTSAAGKGQMPQDTRIMITDSPDSAAYPIAGFTWVILYKEQHYNNRTLAQAQALLKLWDWMLDPDAQAVAQQIDYVPLPASVVALDKSILRTVTYDGKPILQ